VTPTLELHQTLKKTFVMARVLVLSLTVFLICGNALKAQRNPLKTALLKAGPMVDSVINNTERYQVQIIYTQIDRNASNLPTFRSYTYNLDTNLYYYPASTVKMPAAFLALEKINQLKVEGLSKDSPMKIGMVKSPQSAVSRDSSAANGLPSIAQYIKKIFLVSDNDAYNRLYEFLGQEYLNKQLWKKGYDRTRIIHRLSVPGFDSETNRLTNPVTFMNNDGQIIYQQGQVNSGVYPRFNLRKQLRGTGYIEGDNTLVSEPMDFGQRNYIGLEELHDMLKAVMFPEAVAPNERFDFTEEDYRFLYRYLSMLPRESDYPAYPEHAHQDNYVKFLMFGDLKKDTVVIPSNIRVFNKVGLAYGFISDVAYIVDFDKGVEFMLSATIHVNNDGVYNDGKYEYETIGFPFLGQLGRAIYDYEVSRPKSVRPVLSRYKVHAEDGAATPAGEANKN
jgi:Beta-lactamase enzyme family